MKRFPLIKYCGITREVDVEGAIEAGADALGLNFYPKSKRYVPLRLAEQLCHVAAGRIQRIGVFVNASPQHVADVVQVCQLDGIQLHGDEDSRWLDEAASIDALNEVCILRALSYRGPEDDSQVSMWSTRSLEPDDPVCGILVDAHDPNERGGTGKTARWDLLFPRPVAFAGRPDFDKESAKVGNSFDQRESQFLLDRHETSVDMAPMLLAGGIHPDNVFEACRMARPDGIDVASGIESSPGIKDRDAMLRLADRYREYRQHHAQASK